MLSILIPTYNFDITPLVNELHSQIISLGISFEILVYDDYSKSQLNKNNNTINKLSGCTFKELEFNLGRSAIRNLLALDATYNALLFIDAGTMPLKQDFIKAYVSQKNKKVITGGMSCLEKKPSKPNILRWVYTKKREKFDNSKLTFHSSNFLIQKSMIQDFPFDESLEGYGYEDVLFYETLKKNGVAVHFIDNPVVHQADDSAAEFLLKTENALRNLKILINNGKLDSKSIGVSRAYLTLKSLGLNSFFTSFFRILKPLMINNLNSAYPSMMIFDAYRLGYFCTLKHTN